MKNEKNNVIPFRPRDGKSSVKSEHRDAAESVEDQLRNVDWEAKKAKVKALYWEKTRELDREFQGKLDAAHEASKELEDALRRINDTESFAKDVSSKIAEEISPRITNSFMARMEEGVGRSFLGEMNNLILKTSQETKIGLKNDIWNLASKFFMIVYGGIILVAVIIYLLHLE